MKTCPYCHEQIPDDVNICPECGENISPINNGVLDFLKPSKKKIISTGLFVLLMLLIYFVSLNVSNYYHFRKALNNKDFTGQIILVEASKSKAFRQIAKGVQYKLYDVFGDGVHIEKYYRNKAVIYADKYIPIEDMRAVMSKPFLMFKKKGSEDAWVNTDITEKLIKKSFVATSPDNDWLVIIEFNKEGKEKFANLTKELVGKQLAIFYNGKLMSAPRINEPILEGKVQVSGGEEFFYDVAEKMSNILQAGADLKVIEVKP